MLTFDRLKVISPIHSIHLTDEEAFEKIVKGGELVALLYEQALPFKLRLRIDYRKGEVSTEFTGKVLGHDYPRLISRDNIRECFTNIEQLGLCVFDMDMMLDSAVVSCDVSKDIMCDDIKGLTSYMKSHISNYAKYDVRLMKNGNLILANNVSTKDIAKRMTVYDKAKEMRLAKNVRFILDNDIETAFDGKCRFELNLKSQKLIRTALNILCTDLNAVLSSTANPIVDFLRDAIFASPCERNFTSMKAYIYTLVLEDCNYDMRQLEDRIRSILPKRGASIKRTMQPIRELYDTLDLQGEDNGCIYSKVLEMLKI